MVDPVQEFADSGVDPVQVLFGAALTPAHHACQEPGFLVARDQRAATVTLAGVLPTGPQPSTEHVPGDVELGVAAALLQWDPRQLQALQEASRGARLSQKAPATHSGEADGCQGPAERAVLSWEADGDYKGA